jgi:NTE family protein
LGGGAAFGIAHIGVLKVLDDNNIPVDMVTGTSMGSAIAIGYASGLDGREMMALARKMGTIRTTLSAARDITLFNSGILGGKGLKKR